MTGSSHRSLAVAPQVLRRRWIVVPLLLAVLGATARSAESAGDNGDIDPQRVRDAIDKGVAYLKRSQGSNAPIGCWPDHYGYAGGTTALCTLALLNCGVPVDDEHVQKALAFLRTIDTKSSAAKVYTISLQTMVLALAEPVKSYALIKRNALWLEEQQIRDPVNPRNGAWSYPGQGGGDNSNAQFALLALYEAERAGAPVNQSTWRLALEYWKSAQNIDGSFNYYKMPGIHNPPATGSMTCAGIASLVIASGQMSHGDARADGQQVQCCGAGAVADDSGERIENALRWLGARDNFSVEQNPNAGEPWHYYYLYALERVGRMTARRFIGGHDWYREGTAFLVNAQQLNGQWQASKGIEADPDITTSFALLFLGKGRRPILMSKLQHGPAGDWNRHRDDVANLTEYVESRPEWKKDFPLGLTWQVADLSKASVEDLLQSPVLFLNGSQPLEIDDREGQILRDYIDRGGFLFAEACCDDATGFDRSFRALVKKIFPADYQLKPLPPDHPIWHAEEKVPPGLQRTLLGIDYGCRTSVIYCPPPEPGDPPHGLSCLWELSGEHGRTLSNSVASNVAAANSIGLNVLSYATNRELKYKYENFATKPEKSTDDLDRGIFYIAKLKHTGGCDTAPAALPNLLRAAAKELKIRVNTDQRLIDIMDPALFNYTLVFMHGRRAFHFTDAERQQLRTYFHRGGTLLADSICANPEFTEAFRQEMQAVFAGDPDVPAKEQRLAPIPATHPLFGTTYGGYDISHVTLRQPQGISNSGRAAAIMRQIPPALEGVKVGDRFAVIFSKYDLSCALEKHDSVECEGYTRDDAERIGLNVLLYTLHQ